MKRRDFLKTCVVALAGIFLLKWARPFETLGMPGMKEARFYRSADTLAG